MNQEYIYNTEDEIPRITSKFVDQETNEINLHHLAAQGESILATHEYDNMISDVLLLDEFIVKNKARIAEFRNANAVFAEVDSRILVFHPLFKKLLSLKEKIFLDNFIQSPAIRKYSNTVDLGEYFIENNLQWKDGKIDFNDSLNILESCIELVDDYISDRHPTVIPSEFSFNELLTEITSFVEKNILASNRPMQIGKAEQVATRIYTKVLVSTTVLDVFRNKQKRIFREPRNLEYEKSSERLLDKVAVIEKTLPPFLNLSFQQWKKKIDPHNVEMLSIIDWIQDLSENFNLSEVNENTQLLFNIFQWNKDIVGELENSKETIEFLEKGFEKYLNTCEQMDHGIFSPEMILQMREKFEAMKESGIDLIKLTSNFNVVFNTVDSKPHAIASVIKNEEYHTMFFNESEANLDTLKQRERITILFHEFNHIFLGSSRNSNKFSYIIDESITENIAQDLTNTFLNDTRTVKEKEAYVVEREAFESCIKKFCSIHNISQDKLKGLLLRKHKQAVYNKDAVQGSSKDLISRTRSKISKKNDVLKNEHDAEMLIVFEKYFNDRVEATVRAKSEVFPKKSTSNIIQLALQGIIENNKE